MKIEIIMLTTLLVFCAGLGIIYAVKSNDTEPATIEVVVDTEESQELNEFENLDKGTETSGSDMTILLLVVMIIMIMSASTRRN